MIAVHPNILEKNGKKEFAVLPFEEFLQIQEELLDFEDLKDLREAKNKEQNVKGLSFSEAKKELKIWTKSVSAARGLPSCVPS